jgi:hypothetical protein
MGGLIDRPRGLFAMMGALEVRRADCSVVGASTLQEPFQIPSWEGLQRVCSPLAGQAPAVPSSNGSCVLLVERVWSQGLPPLSFKRQEVAYRRQTPAPSPPSLAAA